MRAQLRPQLSRFAEERERHVRRRGVEREPGDVRRVGLAAGERLVVGTEPDRGPQPLKQPQRLRLTRSQIPDGGACRRLREGLCEVLEAPPVARDDRPLLARERPQ